MTAIYSPLVQDLWKRSGAGYGFISTLDRNTGKWADIPHEWDKVASYEQEEGVDLFFSPLTFEKPVRQVLYHHPASILFADLDTVDPESLQVRPHAAWATSPGSYQAVWFLSEPVAYRTAWADLNRRMTYATGADKGGWAGSKVLRVPGTLNYKRGGVEGEMLWYDKTTRPYTRGELDHKLPSLEELDAMVRNTSPTMADAPQVITDQGELNKIWEGLPPGVQFDLRRTSVRDRSSYIVSMSHRLAEAAVPISDAFHMLWYAPYNKWRARNNPTRLWVELVAAYEKHS